ncbi:MAG TPA: glycosyltransferase [Candidatus Saccharimonadales bacterium]
MNISVVIPAHNEATALPSCFEALAHQKTQRNIEVIVVDNASTDQTEAAAASGSSYIVDGAKLTNWIMRVGMPFSLRLYRLLIGHYILTRANFAIRRRAYEAAGGFDLDQDMLDDADLAFRVSRVGRTLYLKEPKVLTGGDIFKYGYIQGFWHYARHLPPFLGRYWFDGRRPSGGE